MNNMQRIFQRYDCNLEGFAYLELANHSYYNVGLDIARSAFERLVLYHNKSFWICL